MTVEASMMLADLVIEDGRRARVLERFGIDYCCHGHRSLSDATAEADVDLDEVRKALDLPKVSARETARSQERAALAHDIIDTHHAYMWAEMPRLHALVAKVHQVHGDRHPELARVNDLFTEAVAALDPHMTKEERSVFPAISRLEKTGSPGGSGPLADQINLLVQEHTVVGDLFKEINSVTGSYTVPEDGAPLTERCSTDSGKWSSTCTSTSTRRTTSSSRVRSSWSAPSPAIDGPAHRRPRRRQQ